VLTQRTFEAALAVIPPAGNHARHAQIPAASGTWTPRNRLTCLGDGLRFGHEIPPRSGFTLCPGLNRFLFNIAHLRVFLPRTRVDHSEHNFAAMRLKACRRAWGRAHPPRARGQAFETRARRSIFAEGVLRPRRFARHIVKSPRRTQGSTSPQAQPRSNVELLIASSRSQIAPTRVLDNSPTDRHGVSR
jgi:hypothetical protein